MLMLHCQVLAYSEQDVRDRGPRDPQSVSL